MSHHDRSFRGRARLDDAAVSDLRQRFRVDPRLNVGKATLAQMLRALEDEDEEDAGDQPDGDGTQGASATEHPRNAGDYTVVAFVNIGSGGGVGKSLFDDLVRHLGEDFVVDLKTVGKGRMPEDHLVKYARDPNVRILACGGDGTVGWIASSIDKAWKRIFRAERYGQQHAERDCDRLAGRGLKRERGQIWRRVSFFVHRTDYHDHLPVAIMPLGTGNDLSRQFGWGGEFKKHMRGASMIRAVEEGRPAYLDRWRVIILPLDRLDDEAKAWVPQILGEKNAADYEASAAAQSAVAVSTMEGLLAAGDADGSAASLECAVADRGFFDGVFCNYFSIGFDARIAFAFHQEREEHPEKFTSPTTNKLIYVKKTPTAYAKSPQLNGKIRVMVMNEESGETEELPIPRRCKSLVSVRVEGLIWRRAKPHEALGMD